MAAKVMGVPAVVVMPTTAPAVKVDGVRTYGADVIFEGTTSLDRQRRAEAEAAARGLSIIPPFDHPMIIAGQGTVALELLEQVPDLGTVFVPMGGGGLIAGVSAAIKQARPEVRVIGVEPQSAAKMRAALDAGRPVTLDRSSSIADGLMNLRAGDVTFAHVQRFVDDLVGGARRRHRRGRRLVVPPGPAGGRTERGGDHRRGHPWPRRSGRDRRGRGQRRQRPAGEVCQIHRGWGLASASGTPQYPRPADQYPPPSPARLYCLVCTRSRFLSCRMILPGQTCGLLLPGMRLFRPESKRCCFDTNSQRRWRGASTAPADSDSIGVSLADAGKGGAATCVT